MEAKLTSTLPCGNWDSGDGACPLEGKFACNGCKLVMYCGRDCQRKHWGEHKKQCKSYLREEAWIPAWDLEERRPSWAVGEAATNLHNPFMVDKHLWGNTPAIDVLRIRENEGGLDYDKDISILFAASGDLRNVIKTIQSFNGRPGIQINVAINDIEPDITIRNAILLLLVLVTLDDESEKTDIEGLAEAVMHIWYSAMLTKDTLSRLQSKVKPLISEVCKKVSTETSNLTLGNVWHFKSKCSLRLTLREKEWARALTFFEIPENLTAEKARELRHAVVLAPERQDYRDRWYYKDSSPSMRVAKQRFREDGLLLPFGHPRVGFDYPNSTIFQEAKCWPMDDKSDPLGGWPIGEIRETMCPASHDVYGRLYFYLRNVICAFIRKLAAGNIHFGLSVNDVKDLRSIHDETYDRIETSNITDMCWLGTEQTLKSLVPLLKSPDVNPHATLITVYLNAVIEMSVREDADEKKVISKHMPRIFEYLEPRIQLARFMKYPEGAELTRFWDARVLVLNAGELFHRYIIEQNFPEIGERLGIAIRMNNIVDPWPTALKLRPDEPGAREEFDAILASSFSGVERYVEWGRMR